MKINTEHIEGLFEIRVYIQGEPESARIRESCCCRRRRR